MKKKDRSQKAKVGKRKKSGSLSTSDFRLPTSDFASKRIAAIDYGSKRVGIAISDENQRIALPWIIVEVQQNNPLQSTLRALAPRMGEIERILVGLPLLMSGRHGEMAESAKAFAAALQKKVEVPVELWDERLSSKQIERDSTLLRKGRSATIDSAAAALFLQSYLDAKSY